MNAQAASRAAPGSLLRLARAELPLGVGIASCVLAMGLLTGEPATLELGPLNMTMLLLTLVTSYWHSLAGAPTC
jgi:hypothetical protein